MSLVIPTYNIMTLIILMHLFSKTSAWHFSNKNYKTLTGVHMISLWLTTWQLMDDTPVQIFIDKEATSSILLLSTCNKYPVLGTYPKTERNTAIHTGGGMIESHFWIEIPLKWDNQIIQIKVLVCDSECPYDILLGCTSLAQLSAWQDYTLKQLYMQQISISLIARTMYEYCLARQVLYLLC